MTCQDINVTVANSRPINATITNSQPINVTLTKVELSDVNFTALTDTPAAYSGSGNSYVRVNAAEDGLEFVSESTAVDWGEIGGTLSNQTDLQAELDLKLNLAGGTMTGDIDFNSNNLTDPGYIQFDLTATPTHAEGRLHWDDDAKTLELGMAGGEVKLQIGQEILLRAKNTSGSTILNGTPVYISGASGSNPTIAAARADNHIIANATLAVATEDIADNSFGYSTTYGSVRDIDTDIVSADGAPVFLGETGGLVASLPNQPNSQVFIGVVLRKHATEGKLFVKIINQPNIDELSNISISSVADKNVLQYNLASTIWENKTVNQIITGADHTLLTNIGTNTHAQIDTFIGTTVPDTYVPYTGATTNVDLGANDLTLTDLNANGNIEIPTTTSTVGQIKQNGGNLLNTFGDHNIFMGNTTGNLTLTTANRNVVIGDNSGYSLTTGERNFGLGYNTIPTLTTGYSNIAIGQQAMGYTTGGAKNNVAIGALALYGITDGNQSTPSENVAIGTNAMIHNYYQTRSVAIGTSAMRGAGNTITGGHIGSGNVAIGYNSMLNIGGAGYSDRNIAIGRDSSASLTGGDDTITIGYLADVSSGTSQNEMVIGNSLTGAGSNTATWGNTSITDHYFSGNINLNNADNQNIILGAGKDCSISYDGTDMIINPQEVGTGKLKINGEVDIDTGAGNFLIEPFGTSSVQITGGGTFKQIATSAIEYVVAGVTRSKLTTIGLGLGTLSPSEQLTVNGNINFLSDNNKLLFGADDDGSITYDGTDMIFDSQNVGTGDFLFNNGNMIVTPSNTDVGNEALNVNDEFMIKKVSAGGYRIMGRGFNTISAADASGFQLLTSGNSAQFMSAKSLYLGTGYGPSPSAGHIQTQSSYNLVLKPGGVNSFYFSKTTGDMKTYDNIKAIFGTGGDASITYDGTDMIINPSEVGTGFLDILGAKARVYGNGEDVELLIEENAGTHDASLHLRRGGTDWKITNNESLIFELEGSEIWKMYSSGNVQYYGDARFNDNDKIRMGTNFDCEMYYDGTDFRLETNDINPSDFKVDCGTNKTLELQHAVTDDMQIDIGAVKLPPSQAAAIVLNPANDVGLAVEFTNASTESIHFNMQSPHARVDESDIEFHIHVTPGASTNTGNVRMSLEYDWKNINGTYGGTTTVYKTFAMDGTAHKHQYEDIATISGTGMSCISSIICCKLTRLGSDALDTFTGDIYAVGMDFHCILNTLGSRQPTTK